MRKQANGLKGEWRVYGLLQQYDRQVHKMRYLDAFDLRVDDLRVEVKTAKPQRQFDRYALLTWCFNIHRHGKMPEKQPDCYLFRLEDMPYSRHGIHLVFLAPILTPTVSISILGLLSQKYHKEYSQFIALTQGTLKPSQLSFPLSTAHDDFC